MVLPHMPSHLPSAVGRHSTYLTAQVGTLHVEEVMTRPFVFIMTSLRDSYINKACGVRPYADPNHNRMLVFSLDAQRVLHQS